MRLENQKDLSVGEIEKVNQMLGRCYRIFGVVCLGKKWVEQLVSQHECIMEPEAVRLWSLCWSSQTFE